MSSMPSQSSRDGPMLFYRCLSGRPWPARLSDDKSRTGCRRTSSTDTHTRDVDRPALVIPPGCGCEDKLDAIQSFVGPGFVVGSRRNLGKTTKPPPSRTIVHCRRAANCAAVEEPSSRIAANPVVPAEYETPPIRRSDDSCTRSPSLKSGTPGCIGASVESALSRNHVITSCQ